MIAAPCWNNALSGHYCGRDVFVWPRLRPGNAINRISRLCGHRVVQRCEDAMNLKGNRLTWVGHATFRIETAEGKTVYVDPWVMSNPLCPEGEREVKKADALICTHGHGDHIGDAVRIAKDHDPVVVGIFKLCMWIQKK